MYRIQLCNDSNIECNNIGWGCMIIEFSIMCHSLDIVLKNYYPKNNNNKIQLIKIFHRIAFHRYVPCILHRSVTLSISKTMDMKIVNNELTQLRLQTFSSCRYANSRLTQKQNSVGKKCKKRNKIDVIIFRNCIPLRVMPTVMPRQ